MLARSASERFRGELGVGVLLDRGGFAGERRLGDLQVARGHEAQVSRDFVARGNSTRSPGTSSVEGTRTGLARANDGRFRHQASRQRLDGTLGLGFLQVADEALIITTPKMTAASTKPPIASLIPPAASRM